MENDNKAKASGSMTEEEKQLWRDLIGEFRMLRAEFVEFRLLVKGFRDDFLVSQGRRYPDWQYGYEGKKGRWLSE